jgi:hypothetical protein
MVRRGGRAKMIALKSIFDYLGLAIFIYMVEEKHKALFHERFLELNDSTTILSDI